MKRITIGFLLASVVSMSACSGSSVEVSDADCVAIREMASDLYPMFQKYGIGGEPNTVEYVELIADLYELLESIWPEVMQEHDDASSAMSDPLTDVREAWWNGEDLTEKRNALRPFMEDVKKFNGTLDEKVQDACNYPGLSVEESFWVSTYWPDNVNLLYPEWDYPYEEWAERMGWE